MSLQDELKIFKEYFEVVIVKGTKFLSADFVTSSTSRYLAEVCEKKGIEFYAIGDVRKNE